MLILLLKIIIIIILIIIIIMNSLPPCGDWAVGGARLSVAQELDHLNVWVPERCCAPKIPANIHNYEI